MTEKTERERLASIETDMEHIKKALDGIKDNHLKSIYKKLTDLELKIFNKVPPWATIVISFLSSLVIGLITYGVMRR